MNMRQPTPSPHAIFWLLLLTGCAMGGPGALGGVDDEPVEETSGVGAGDVGSSSSSSGETTSSGQGGDPSTGGGGSGGAGPVGCGANEQKCGGVCMDVLSSAVNCGACGVVCADSDCVNGQCQGTSSSSASSSSSSSSGGVGGGGGGSCHPLFPEAVCGPGTHCLPQPNHTPTCEGPSGAGEQYTYCTDRSDCGPGYDCVTTGPYAFCLAFCTQDGDCANYYDHCYAFDPPVYVGNQEWGACYNGIS